MIYVSSFTLDVTATSLQPIYYKSYGSAISPFSARSFAISPDPNYAYVFGSTKSKLSLHKINANDGSSPFTYSVSTPTSVGTTKTIAIGKVQKFLALYTIVACAEGLGGD